MELNREEELIEILKNQIDPYGRYHYHGISSKEERALSLKKEAGDMTYHTGIVLQFLAIRYLVNPSETLPIIESLFSYLEKVRINGIFRRELAFEEEYKRFFPSEKHCSKGTLFGLDSGPCAKWTLTKDGLVRYDVSLDAISSLVTGLYFVQKYIFPLRFKVLEWLEEMYNSYRKSHYMIRDLSNNKPCRFGNHIPYIIPLGYLVKNLLEYLLFGDCKRYWHMDFIIENLRTYVTGIFSNKKKRFAYNGYMFSMILNALSEFDPIYKKGLQNLLNEAKGEENLYFYALARKHNLNYKLFFGTDLDKYIISGYEVNKFIGRITPLDQRLFINRWESSAYTLGIPIKLPLFYCNEDLLQAYWTYKEKELCTRNGYKVQ